MTFAHDFDTLTKRCRDCGMSKVDLLDAAGIGGHIPGCRGYVKNDPAAEDTDTPTVIVEGR